MNEQNALQDYSTAGISDVLSIFGIPTATAVEIYKRKLAKRKAVAMELLLSEIRMGNFDNIDKTDLICVVARYQRDAMEGVSKNNLRLLARLIKGMAEKDSLKAPTFNQYASTLASLTKDELTALSIMVTSKDRKTCETRLNETLGDNGIGIQQSLIRTGLVTISFDAVGTPKSIDDIGRSSVSNEMVFELTPLMDKILLYVDLTLKESQV